MFARRLCSGFYPLLLVACAACTSPTPVAGPADTDTQSGEIAADALDTTDATPSGCPSSLPFPVEGGGCAECLKHDDCGTGLWCEVLGHSCMKKPGECALCVDPYPECIVLGGVPSCVACTNDSTCASKDLGTCSKQTFLCSKAATAIDGNAPGCQTNADCVNIGGTAFDLACDATATQLCYDKSGKCDNIIAFCNAKNGCECEGIQTDTWSGTCSCGF